MDSSNIPMIMVGSIGVLLADDATGIGVFDDFLIPVVMGIGVIAMTVDYAKEVFFEQEKDKDRSKLAEYDFPDSPDPGNNPGQPYSADDQRKYQSIEDAGNVDNFIKSNVNKNFQQNVKNAFGTDAKVTTLTQDTTVYRYHGGVSVGKSYWYTPYQTTNPAADLALPSGNTYQYMDTYLIPKGTTILEGSVAPNFGQSGGGYQFYVPDPTVVIPK